MNNYSVVIHEIKSSLREIRKTNRYDKGKYSCYTQWHALHSFIRLASMYIEDGNYEEGLNDIYTASVIIRYFFEMYFQGYPIFFNLTGPSNWKYVLLSMITQDQALIKSIGEYWSLLTDKQFNQWLIKSRDVIHYYWEIPYWEYDIAKLLSLLISKKTEEAKEFFSISKRKYSDAIYRHVYYSMEAIAAFDKTAFSTAIQNFNRGWKHAKGCINDNVNLYGAALICLAQHVWNEELDLSFPLIPVEITHARPPYTAFPFSHEFFEIPPENEIENWKNVGVIVKKQNWLARVLYSIFHSKNKK